MQPTLILRTLPLAAIKVVDNPRTFFDPSEMSVLETSVRANGILQSVLVRRLEPCDAGGESFALVAGERRFRAAIACGLVHVPALIFDGDKEAAAEFALIENTARADMSATEEAQAAERSMQRHGSNKAEVLRHLGWSSTKLEQRLALLRCVPEVRIALNERKILLGHAELLAAVPAEKQLSSLPLIIEHKLTVAYVKQNLAKVAQSLQTAIFDQTECLTCPSNTVCQSALFVEALDEGYCTNAQCYDNKTTTVLHTMRDELTQDYPTVKIVALGDNVQTARVAADGKLGVGADQAKACMGCENFGCTISSLPTSTGQVERNLCFDLVCNASKVAALVRASAVAAPASRSSKGDANLSTKAKGLSKKVVSVQTPTKVKEYRVALWRTVAKNELFKRPDDAITVLVMLGVIGSARNISSTRMSEAYARIMPSAAAPTPAAALQVLKTLQSNPAEKGRLLAALSASAMGEICEQQLIMILQFLECDLNEHWKLCTEFLLLLTKSEIEAVADELGIKKVMGERFAKAALEKKDQFIKTVLSVPSFDYSRAIPVAIQYAGVSPAAIMPPLVNHEVEHDETDEELTLSSEI